jgi:hypothetical protein
MEMTMVKSLHNTIFDYLKDGLKEVGSLVWSKTDPGKEVGKQTETHDHLQVRKFSSPNPTQTTITLFLFRSVVPFFPSSSILEISNKKNIFKYPRH